MERKWYLDLWLLVTSPFKRGIPEIVEFGTIQRGFAATVAMVAITLVFSAIIELLLAYVFGVHIAKLGSVMGQFAGQGIMSLTLGLISLFATLAIYSIIFSQVANKFGSNTNYESILKICWYQSAYTQFLSIMIGVLEILLIIIAKVLGFYEVSSTMGLTIFSYFFQIINVGAFIWVWWVSLTLMARQIEKNRLATFGITLISALIPVIVIVSLFVIIALASSR
jgi:hypothetical protein